MRLVKFLKVCLCGLRNLFWWLTLFPRKAMLWLKNTDSDSDDGCEYDSTWEDEVKTFKKKRNKSFTRSRRNMYAARDMQEFRHSCTVSFIALKVESENLDDSASKIKGASYSHTLGQGYMPTTHYKDHFYNLEFYKGSRRSVPDNVSIYEFHDEWKGKYDRLERVHSYIQWLFPIQEKGMNWEAHVLTKKEIKKFCQDEKAKGNLLESYKLMLDFYGIRLVDDFTGEVTRAHNWKERFYNLNRNTHNNLRITRILKCLGTLGFEHFQEKLVRFFLQETLVENRLPNVKQSVLDYFIFAVLDKSQRKSLIKFAFWNFQPRKDFVWGPKKILSGTEMYEYAKKETKIAKRDISTASGERRGTPSSCSYSEDITRKNSNGQKSESSQRNDAMHDEKPVVSSDQTTSDKSKDKGQVKGEDHQVRSKSPQGGKRNGVGSHNLIRQKSNFF